MPFGQVMFTYSNYTIDLSLQNNILSRTIKREIDNDDSPNCSKRISKSEE